MHIHIHLQPRAPRPPCCRPRENMVATTINRIATTTINKIATVTINRLVTITINIIATME